MGTVLLSAFKNLHPGESRDFECPMDVPDHPDPVPGTEADRRKYGCDIGWGIGLPCFDSFRHGPVRDDFSDLIVKKQYDRAPKPDSVNTTATVGNTAN